MDDLTAEDPRVTRYLDSLDADLPLTEVVDREFVDQRIFLDGRYFSHCVFTRCEFVSRLGAWQLAGCDLIDHKGLILNGPSARLQMLIDQSIESGGALYSTIGYRDSDLGGRA